MIQTFFEISNRMNQIPHEWNNSEKNSSILVNCESINYLFVYNKCVFPFVHSNDKSRAQHGVRFSRQATWFMVLIIKPRTITQKSLSHFYKCSNLGEFSRKRSQGHSRRRISRDAEKSDRICKVFRRKILLWTLCRGWISGMLFHLSFVSFLYSAIYRIAFYMRFDFRNEDCIFSFKKFTFERLFCDIFIVISKIISLTLENVTSSKKITSCIYHIVNL